MFVVLLTYTAPLEQIDQHMPAHMAYLQRCYQAGMFVASGRRVPRTGGVILAQAPDRVSVEQVVALDPFVAEGLATAEVVEFRTSQHSSVFAPLADPGTAQGRTGPV